jgi:peptidoglycan/LPS O-acetylase OafA/YrhL
VLENPTRQLQYSAAQWIAYHLLAALIALLLFFPAVFSERGRGLPHRVLSMRPLAWVGVISYSVYLWQGGVVEVLYNHRVGTWIGGHPAISLVLASVAVSLALGSLSYYFFERPILRFKTRRIYLARPSGASTRATR